MVSNGKKVSLLKRSFSFFLAMILVITTPAIAAFAVPGDGRDDPLTDTNDLANFPAYPDPGAISTGKDIQWIDDENIYARVQMDINSIPSTRGADIVLVLDRSGSMGKADAEGNSTLGNSPCYNDAHTKTYTFSKQITYFTSPNGVTFSGSSNRLTDTITIEATVHTQDNGYNPVVTEFMVSGFQIDNPNTGDPIVAYCATSNGANAWTLDGWNDNYNRFIISELCSTNWFGNVMDSTNTVAFPTDKAKVCWSNTTGYYDESKGCIFRIDIAKDAAKSFVDKVFEPFTFTDWTGAPQTSESDFRISLVTFSSSATAIDGGTFFAVDDKDALKGHIDGMTTDGGTSYVSAMDAAKAAIENRGPNAAKRDVYLVFMSDGLPEAAGEDPIGNNLAPAVQNAIDGVKVLVKGSYGIGVGIQGIVGENHIKAIASSDANAIILDDKDSSKLVDIFNIIAQQIVKAGENAVIKDIISSEFEIVDKDFPEYALYPWGVRIGGIVDDKALENVTVDKNSNTIAWNMGNIPVEAVFSFYIKIKPNVEIGQWLYPNEKGTINYQNYDEKWCEQEFDSPGILYPGGSILIVRYLTDANGNAISKNGTPLANNDINTIMSSFAVRFYNSPYKDPDTGKVVLELGKPYSDVENNFVHNTTDLKLNKLRLYDSKNKIYTPIAGNTWNITVSTHQDAFVVLVGYAADFKLTVVQDLDGTPSILSSDVTLPTTDITMDAPSKSGYELTGATFTITDIDDAVLASQYHNITLEAPFYKLIGNMPYGNVTVTYTYTSRPDTHYTVEYYTDSYDPDNFQASKDYYGPTGSAIDYHIADNCPPNYTIDGAQTGGDTTIKGDGSSVGWVVYVTKKIVKYNYNYATEEDSVRTIVEAVEKEGLAGDPPDLTGIDWEDHVPPGYEGEPDIIYPNVLDPDAGDANDVWIVWSEKNLKDIEYTVEYYTGTDTDTFDTATLWESDTRLGKYKSAILPLLTPTGYTQPPTKRDGPETVGLNPSANIVKFLFTNLIDNVPYMIYYCKGDKSDVDHGEPGSGKAFSTPDFKVAENCPPGYDPNNYYIDPSDTATLDPEGVNEFYVVYYPLTDLEYEIRYYRDSIDSANLIDSLTDHRNDGYYGMPIDVNLWANIPDGYAGPATRYGADTVKETLEKSIVNIVFENRLKVDFRVEYRKGSFDGELIYVQRGLKATYGVDPEDEVHISYTDYCPDGYIKPGWRDYDNGITTIGAVASDNVVYIIFDAEGGQSYLINYYRGSLDSANLYDHKTVDNVKVGSYIDIGLFDNPPKGFEGPALRYGPWYVQPGGSVVNVVFVKRIQVPYRVEYYKDSVTNPDGPFMTIDNLTGAYGTNVFVDPYLNAPPGYDVPAIRSGVGLLGATGLTEDDNVIYLVFNKLDAYEYVIKYYQDSYDPADPTANHLGDVKDKGAFGNPIIPDITKFRPDGYKVKEIIPANPKVGLTLEESTVIVVYEKADLSYKITYWKDSVGGQWLGEEIGNGLIGQLYSDLIADVDSLYAPTGYYTPGRWDGPTAVRSENNVANVVYDIRLSRGYEIYYYKDSKTGQLLGHEQQLTGYVGTPIIPNWSVYQPAGYIIPGTIYDVNDTAVTMPLISEDASANVYYAIYDKKQQSSYTINYYKDNLLPANLLADRTDLNIPAAVGDDITFNAMEKAPDGYSQYDYIWYGPTVVRTSNNTVNIVFTTKLPAIRSQYIINYYQDEVDVDNLVWQVKDTGEVGDPIFVDLYLKVPMGYKGPGTKTPAGTRFIDADPANNIISVVYTNKEMYPYTVRFWKDSAGGNGTLLDTKAGDLPLGATIPLDETPYAAMGYLTPGDRTGDLVIKVGNNLVDVVYRYYRGDIPYEIRYYKDSYDPANPDENYRGTYNGTGTVGDLINVNITSDHKPAGYANAIKVAGPDRILAPDPNDPEKNVVIALYDELAEYAYEIRYYVDSYDQDNPDTNYLGSFDGSGALGDPIDINITNKYQQPGYNGPVKIDGPDVIGKSDNIVIALYGRDDFIYTVEYYREGEANPFHIDPEHGPLPLGAPIPYDIDANVPTGYTSVGATVVPANPVIVADASANVVKVTYLSSSRLTYDYIVNYYKDAVAGNPDKTVPGSGLYGDNIPYDLDANRPTGYTTDNVLFDYSNPDTATQGKITDDPDLNIVNIVYTTKKTDCKVIVNYYKDSVSDDNLLPGSPNISNSATFDAPFQLNLDYARPAGYNSGVINSTVPNVTYAGNVVYIEAEEIIVNIVYAGLNSYEYEITYYKDSVSAGNIFGLPVTGNAKLNELINVTPDASHIPLGYDGSKYVVDPNPPMMVTEPTGVFKITVVFTDMVPELEYQIHYFVDWEPEETATPDLQTIRLYLGTTRFPNIGDDVITQVGLAGETIVLSDALLNEYYADVQNRFLPGVQKTFPVLGAVNPTIVEVHYKMRKTAKFFVEHYYLDGTPIEEEFLTPQNKIGEGFIGTPVTEDDYWNYAAKIKKNGISYDVDHFVPDNQFDLVDTEPENNTTLKIYYKPTIRDRSFALPITIDQFISDYDVISDIITTEEEVMSEEPTDVNDLLLEGYGDPIITIIAVSNDLVLDSNDIDLDDIADQNVVDKVSGIIDESVGREVIVTTLEDGETEFTFENGYQYTMIINYHSIDSNEPFIDLNSEVIADGVAILDTGSEEIKKSEEDLQEPDETSKSDEEEEDGDFQEEETVKEPEPEDVASENAEF